MSLNQVSISISYLFEACLERGFALSFVSLGVLLQFTIYILCFGIVRDPRKNVLIPFNSDRKQYRDGYGLRLERQRYDGWYNNMAHPEWGAVGNNDSCKLI